MIQAKIEEKRYLDEVRNAEICSIQNPPLKKVTDDLEKELNLNFLLNDNVDATQKTGIIFKKKIIRHN